MYDKYNNNLLCLFSIILITTFSGCIKQYKIKPLLVPSGNIQEHEKVKIIAKTISSEKSKYYFGQDVKKKGYEIIQLYVSNQSDKSLKLDFSNINQKLEHCEDVAKKLRINTAKLVFLRFLMLLGTPLVNGSATGLLFVCLKFGNQLSSLIGSLFSVSLVTLSVSSFLFFPGLMFTIADGRECKRSNRKLTNDLNQKLLYKENSSVLINQNKDCNFLMFVFKKNYNNNLQFSLLVEGGEGVIESTPLLFSINLATK
jgi:hypothetical protein